MFDIMAQIPCLGQMVLDSLGAAREDMVKLGERRNVAKLLLEVDWLRSRLPEDVLLRVVLYFWLRFIVEEMSYLPLYDSWLHCFIHQIRIATQYPNQDHVWNVIKEMLE